MDWFHCNNCVWTFFSFKDIPQKGLEACSVIIVRFRNMLQDMVIPELQQHGSLALRIFQKDSSPSHTAREAQNLLQNRRHFKMIA